MNSKMVWDPVIDMSNNFATLGAGWIGFFGALAGGFVTYLGVRKTLKHAEQTRDNEKKDLLLSLYQALYSELEALRDVYVNGDWGTYIKSLEPEDYISSHFPIGADYFIIYKSNTYQIGLIPDKNLRQSVISLYVKMMGMIDSIAFNNFMLSQLEEFLRAGFDKNPPITPQVGKMREYAKKIKKNHAQLQEEIDGLLITLHNSAVSLAAKR
jgi:hypothetical protein